jgi:hypothetical protein
MKSPHKPLLLALTPFLGLSLTLLAPSPLHAQASAIPSAQPAPPAGADSEKRARILIDEMVEALGGSAWINLTSIAKEGHTASFFRGDPTLSDPQFWEYDRLPPTGQPEAQRLEFTKKRDVVQIWTPDNGYEITYKGNKPLPADQVKDTLRRQTHSVEAVVRTWLKQPGIVILYEGTTMVERRMAEKVTLLGADNDAVTLELEASTHLPLRLSFQSRNQTFKDFDEDAEEYDEWHLIQGIQTPFIITRYHNGDLTAQRYFSKVEYDIPLTPEMFDITLPLKEGKKKK